MLASGKRDCTNTMGRDEGQRQRVKTMGRTKGDFVSCNASAAALGNEQGVLLSHGSDCGSSQTQELCATVTHASLGDHGVLDTEEAPSGTH